MKEHPGGKKVLIKVAGKDASRQFHNLHKPAVLTQYGPGLLIGQIGGSVASDPKKNSRQLANGEFGEQIPYGVRRPPPVKSTPLANASPPCGL